MSMNGLGGEEALILGMDYVDKKINGAGGVPGFSPKITENENNTNTDYKLDIETADGTFTTPNLMASVVVDSSLNYYSQNPVQNRVVTNKFDKTVAGEVYIPVSSLQVFYVTVPLRYQEDTTGDKHLIILSDSLGDLIFVSGLSKNRTIKAYRVGTVAEPNIKKLYYKNLDDYYKAELYIERTNGNNPITIYGATGASSYTQYGGVSGLVEIEIENVSSGCVIDELLDIESTNAIQNKAVAEALETKATVYTSLDQLGLTAPTTVGEVFVAMPDKSMLMLNIESLEHRDDAQPTVTDVPKDFGILTIEKHAPGRHRIEYSSSLGGNASDVRKWIGSIKGNTGENLSWKELTASLAYTTLAQLGLTADATIQNVIDALPIGGNAIIRTDSFADLTQFKNLPYAYLSIDKTVNGMCKMELYDVTSKNYAYKGRQAGGKFVEWINYSNVYMTLEELALTADATLDDAIAAVPYGSTAILDTTLFTNYKTIFPYDCTDDGYATVEINKAHTGSRATLLWIRKSGKAYAIGGLGSDNKFIEWNKHTFKRDGYTPDNVISIGDTLSGNGDIQTLESLGFSNDVMTWKNGIYKISHVTGLTNLPFDNIGEGIRLEHHNLKKWNGNHNPNGTWGARQSFLYHRNGVYTRYTESGATAGVYTTDTGWRKVNTNDSVSLVTNTQTLKLDITKKNSSWYGAIKLTYLYDTSPAEIEITFRSSSEDIRWTHINGQKYINKVTYTQDSENLAHYTIGIEFAGQTYGNYQADVIGDFANINSLTKDAFTGDKTAVYYSPWGKNNGVSLVSAPEDIGLTFPCTSVQLAQAMRNKFNKTITSGAIGVFNCGGKTVTITDAPSDYGLLHIECFGHDRILIRYDGISSSTYAGSWIGKIKGNNGTFSGIEWERIDDTYSTTETAVGTWIDGSTIYRTVVEFNSVEAKTSESEVQVATNIPVATPQKVIRMEGFVNLIGNQFYIHYPNITCNDDTIKATVNIANGNVKLKGTWKYPIGKGALILEYTK